MAANKSCNDIKLLSQDVRINSAFNCIYEQFEKGQHSKAFEFFSNTIKSEVEFAIEDERLVLNDEALLARKKELENFVRPITFLNELEASSE